VSRSWLVRCALVLLPLGGLSLSWAAETAPAGKMAADKTALSTLQDYVGGWRGVGQLQRGSAKGAWSEDADWAWEFKEGRAGLVFQTPAGKYWKSGKITPADQAKTFRLTATLPDGQTTETFEGALQEDGKLVLSATKASEGRPARVSVYLVAMSKRLILFLERPLGETGRFTRLAEIGYTREGSEFAAGPSYPECVVTGGYANMTVTYMGQTYLVCCEGCRDLFEMDPAGVLAEYRERKAKEREDRKNK